MHQKSYIDFLGRASPGSVGKTNVFVRNEELTPSCYMALSTGDWIPLAASGYLMLSWNYDGREIALGEAIPTTLTLKVSEDIHGITDFSFNITIFGTEYNLGDINHDGVVNIYDMVKVAGAYNSTPSASNWNPEADLNGDGTINIYDVTILSQYYGFAS